jgi:hypothetical protein
MDSLVMRAIKQLRQQKLIFQELCTQFKTLDVRKMFVDTDIDTGDTDVVFVLACTGQPMGSSSKVSPHYAKFKERFYKKGRNLKSMAILPRIVCFFPSASHRSA